MLQDNFTESANSGSKHSKPSQNAATQNVTLTSKSSQQNGQRTQKQMQPSSDQQVSIENVDHKTTIKEEVTLNKSEVVND